MPLGRVFIDIYIPLLLKGASKFHRELQTPEWFPLSNLQIKIFINDPPALNKQPYESFARIKYKQSFKIDQRLSRLHLT